MRLIEKQKRGVCAILKLLIDSREQQPLRFRKGAFDEYEVKGLPFGDYSCELDGEPIPIVFERKGFGDLFGTMTSRYERFKKEVGRAKESNAVLVLVIEGSLAKIEGGYKHSRYGGDSMLKKLAMLRVRHDLEWYCFGTRKEMARFIEEIFNAVQRNYKKNPPKPPSSTGEGEEFHVETARGRPSQGANQTVSQKVKDEDLGRSEK